MKCLDDNDVALLTDGAPSPEERRTFNGHLDTCASCRELMAQTLRTVHAGARLLNPGEKLGRYFVLELIGAGAMGVVYAAFDPQLDRKVALKVMRAEVERGEPRLLQEAKSLARLSHPHVVTVHDVGVEQGQMFLALEFASGGTLRSWLASPRDWQSVVRTVSEAGEGLAAAHEAGLVHRDLKPENIVLDDKARARVTDFGLARGDEGGAPGTDLRSTSRQGTPVYMAPEVLAGRVASAASDQFSFCVTLYEALAGRRPFEGETLEALMAAVQRVPEPVKGVPGWLNQALARGLSVEPSQRFPSMQALLRALRTGLEGRSRRGVFLALAAVVPVVVLGLTLQQRGQCTGGPAVWDHAWSSELGARVTAAMVAANAVDGPELAQRTNAAFDALQTRWLATYVSVCEATRVRGEQSDVLLDARLACLHQRREEAAALASLLARPGSSSRALEALASLTAPEACTSVLSLQVATPVDPAEQAKAATLLARAVVGVIASEHDEANAALASLEPLVERPGFERERAQTKWLEGRVLVSMGKLVEGERMLHEAVALAEDAGDDAIAADVWLSLSAVTGLNRAHPEEARWWLRDAQAAIHRMGGDAAREGFRLRQLAMLTWRFDGDIDESRKLAAQARALLEPLGARSERALMQVDEVLAGVEFELGRYDEALQAHLRILEVCRRLQGPQSLSVAEVNVGEDLTMLGRFDEALPHLERAVEFDRPPHRVKGVDGHDLHRLALYYRRKGDPAKALELDRASLASIVEAGQQGSTWESWPLAGIGEDLLALGRAAEAVEPLARAERERVGDAPVDLAEVRASLAEARWQVGEHAEARALIEQALATFTELAAKYGGRFVERQRDLESWLAAHPQ